MRPQGHLSSIPQLFSIHFTFSCFQVSHWDHEPPPIWHSQAACFFTLSHTDPPASSLSLHPCTPCSTPVQPSPPFLSGQWSSGARLLASAQAQHGLMLPPRLLPSPPWPQSPWPLPAAPWSARWCGSLHCETSTSYAWESRGMNGGVGQNGAWSG